MGGPFAGGARLSRAAADPLWMQSVVADAAGRFREAFPGIELRLRSAGRSEGLRELAAVGADAVEGAGILIPGAEEVASGERGRP